jgi:opacity protein-like surface antigen
MKIRPFIVGLLVMVSATTAFGAGSYIGVAGGASIFHESDVTISGYPTVKADYDISYGIVTSVGYAFDGPRLEVEFGYKTTSMKNLSYGGRSVSTPSNDLNIMSFMQNAYYDFKTETALTPYIGAGVGFVNAEFNISGSKGDENQFGYQLIVGSAYNINKNLAFDLSYRFQGSSDFGDEYGKISYMSSNIYAGLRFNF